MRIAQAYAGLGRRVEAIREAERVIELSPVSRDAMMGSAAVVFLAEAYTTVGEHDAALDPLRDNPRFQKLEDRQWSRDLATWHDNMCHMAEDLMGHVVVEEKAVGEAPDIDIFWRAAKGGKAGPCGYLLLLGLRLQDPIRIAKRVEEGLKFQALERFQKNAQLSTSDLAQVVSIKLRTLHRRKDQGRLEPDESDRLLRVSRIFGKALELFEGDADAARRWFSTPLKGLGGQRPIVLSRTDVGAREVEALIDRLEHGVLS